MQKLYAALASMLLLFACRKESASVADAAPPSSGHALAVVSAPLASSAPAPTLALSPVEFKRLFVELSEPDRYFFSDNWVSNETSYLDVSPILERLRNERGAYVGVGPEQNFAYIAELEPALAFIVDIRRDNALLHLLYKSCFDEAETRTQFLALLIGREGDSSPDASASVHEVLARAEGAAKGADVFAKVHSRLIDRITQGYGVALSDKDRERLTATHRAFFDAGLDLRFELHQRSSHQYPALRELLSEKDRSGNPLGFLASDRAFRTVKRLQHENRIIPVVGDFAGDHALKAIGALLTERGLTVSAFYVSNVEEYLLTPKQWKAWVGNVQALPKREESVFVRAYLDQGRRHPLQQPGRRSTTVAQPLGSLQASTTPPPSLYAITTAGLIER